MTATSTNPIALVLDFSTSLKEQYQTTSMLLPEVAWILYDKTNQQIIKRGHYAINLNTKEPKSKVYASEYILEDINQILKNYQSPEIVLDDHQSTLRLNKNLLTPNLQIENSKYFSVLEDYQEKTDLPCDTLEEVLHRQGLTENNQPLTNLTVRTNKILEYYLKSTARKEREQPYSFVPDQIKSDTLQPHAPKSATPSIWVIISQYFLGLNLMGALILGLQIMLSSDQLKLLAYLLIGLVVSIFIIKHLKR